MARWKVSKALEERLRAGLVQEILLFVRNNYLPELIFSANELHTWAKRNGYERRRNMIEDEEEDEVEEVQAETEEEVDDDISEQDFSDYEENEDDEEPEPPHPLDEVVVPVEDF